MRKQALRKLITRMSVIFLLNQTFESLDQKQILILKQTYQLIKPVFYITILIFLFVNKLQAQQNLVPNGSFEDFIYCPTAMDDFSVSEWINPTTGSPNYLNSCNTADAGVPQNSWGYQSAHSGNAYVGFHTSDFEPFSTNAREYVQSKLLSVLEKDELYEVSFYISRADSCRRACNNIGMYFSESGIGSWDNLNLPYTPQVVSEPNVPIEDDTTWLKVADTIMAIGNEKFITIGVFSDNSNTNWVNVDGSNSWSFESHYYIDDVSIRKLYNIPNIFTPNNDGVNDFLDFSNFPFEIEIYNRWGEKVYSNKSIQYWYGSDDNGNELNDGVYFYKAKNKTGFIQLIR